MKEKEIYKPLLSFFKISKLLNRTSLKLHFTKTSVCSSDSHGRCSQSTNIHNEANRRTTAGVTWHLFTSFEGQMLRAAHKRVRVKNAFLLAHHSPIVTIDSYSHVLFQLLSFFAGIVLRPFRWLLLCLTFLLLRLLFDLLSHPTSAFANPSPFRNFANAPFSLIPYACLLSPTFLVKLQPFGPLHYLQ